MCAPHNIGCGCEYGTETRGFLTVADRLYPVPEIDAVTLDSEIDFYPPPAPIPGVEARRAMFMVEPYGHGNAVHLASHDLGLAELPYGEFPSMI